MRYNRQRGGDQISGRLYRLISQAYDILGNTTPIPADCGKLCGAACCQGDDDVGMLLFPGEAVHLAETPGFHIFRIDYMEGRSWLLTCGGRCNRALRPLACRIFPLGPKVDANGTVTARPDPRAIPMCPLADGEFLDKGFKRRVEKSFALLAREPRMLELMTRISKELDELEQFRA